MTVMKQTAYIITGPTASGKSDFAHKLAQTVNGAIINCDSVQIYRGIENISASPFAGREITDSVDGVPYRLFSILSLDEQISVADYLNLARTEYQRAITDGQVPIFVGGTGYYINALVNGISPMPDVSTENRNRARNMVAENITAVRAMLSDDFPHTDSQRVARALEVFLETGRHITEFQQEPRVGALVPDAYKILINPPTDVLRKRITDRIPLMLSGGAMCEAQLIIDSNWNESRAIGASQLCKFIRGEISKEECIDNWINKTNQYAKRQRTWFRTQFNPDVVIPNVPSDSDVGNVLK